jgi:hypothetical protein
MWISIGVFVILVDTLVNVIIFIVIQDDYKSWCIGSSSGALQTGVESALNSNATNINFSADFYNCQRTWEDELKFGMLSLIMMMIFYVGLTLFAFSRYSTLFFGFAWHVVLLGHLLLLLFHQEISQCFPTRHYASRHGC